MHHDYDLYHHGIKGMKWGVRRYQNKDGSLTPAGEKRYNEKIDRTKSLYGKSRWEGDIKTYEKEISSAKKKGYQKWAEDNYLDGLKDADKKQMYNQYLKRYETKIEAAKKTLSRTDILYKRLDSIDPTSAGYKRAMKMVTEITREWINEGL